MAHIIPRLYSGDPVLASVVISVITWLRWSAVKRVETENNPHIPTRNTGLDK
jgi:hypothetical protein